MVPAIWSLLLTAVILGPLITSPGYLLLRDAVSTPRSYPTDSAWGLSDAAARAVPQDALLAALSSVVDGGLVVTAILAASIWAAGWGAARTVAVLLPTAGLPGQMIAVTVAVWNPYVAERLLQGHWSLLTGYAALPWIVCAVVAVRRGHRAGWFSLAAWFAVAGLTPTGALLAGIVAVVVLAAPGGRTARTRRLAGAVALLVVASAPWLTVTALSGSGTDADPAGVAAFAARAEPWLGTLGSVAGLGGIWNGDAVPASRTTGWALLGTALLLAVVAAGLPALWRRRRNPVLVAVAVLAVVTITAPAVAATGPGIAAGEWAMTHLPGAGLLRDTQKWAAAAMPFYTLAAAAGVLTLRRRSRRVPWSVAAVVAVLVALPDLVWGVGGQIRPVHYPESWRRVTELVTAGDGDVAVLPAGMFRIFDYSGDAPVLDPAPRMLRADVLQTGELVVAGGTVAGEGARAALVEQLLLAGAEPDALAAQGVGWVLVEHTTVGDLGDAARTLDLLPVVYSDDELTLHRVDDPEPRAQPDRTAAIAAHLLWILLLAGGAVGALAQRIVGARKQTGHTST